MTLLEKRIKRLSKGLSSAIARLPGEVSPKSVHRLRTTIRRIESLIAFARPDLGRKQEKCLEDLAKLRKRAGKVRDLDVQTGLLDAIANRSAGADRRVLMDWLEQKRARHAERLESAIRKLEGAKFFSHLHRLEESATATAAPADESETPLQQASQGLSKLAAEFTFHHALRPQLLHEVRIRMKKLRYLAELDEESAEQQGFLRALKSVQDALGAWHDWEGLARTVEKQFGDRVNCPLLVEVRTLFAAKYSAATIAVAQLFSTYTSAPYRKQPRSAEDAQPLARRA
jgi:CHAD domain-containing protein